VTDVLKAEDTIQLSTNFKVLGLVQLIYGSKPWSSAIACGPLHHWLQSLTVVFSVSLAFFISKTDYNNTTDLLLKIVEHSRREDWRHQWGYQKM